MEERLDSEHTQTRDLKECKNWRGVTLLSVVSKVMGEQSNHERRIQVKHPTPKNWWKSLEQG